jgi:uncharacterized protein GlcG (DUF336 family)
MTRMGDETMRKSAIVASAVLAYGLAVAVPAEAQEDALVTFQVLAPKLALDLAVATLDACAEEGYQVAAAVVDRFGVPQALIRDRFAGPHTPETAIRKAWTAASFRTDTLQLDRNLGVPGDATFGARGIPGALVLGGGVLIEVAGQLVGAIGVSGAPSPEADENCARAGLEAVEDRLPW